MACERLQDNYLKFFEKRLLPDVTIIAQGQEIPAHKVILAAQSDWFCNQFVKGGPHHTMTLNYKYKVVYALVRFMYFGNVADDSLGPDDGLDMLLLSEHLGISALEAADIEPLIMPRLTPQNCMNVMEHEGLPKYPLLLDCVCRFVGEHFLQMLISLQDHLMRIPRQYLAKVLSTACATVATDADTNRVVMFCLQHSQMESACDLLRDTKQWSWGSDEPSLMRSAPKEEISEGVEWRIPHVRSAMDGTPARIVVGNSFEWTIRLDYGAEGKLRIVYESATPKEDCPRCINRFPAAMFAWRVLYRGQDVFNEKPVFICFPENVSLHWSTTLPVSAAELADEDEIKIMVNMAENPMLSLVLYYFSSDLRTTVFSEDILNRLPHIEYRCLSSYSLVKTHVHDAA
uniref:BTB domain-containing protein n=1 Tax=Alexandrium catenella TaxID=2925 RepID=A0A7S1S680_ALECA|mmetsp:Transcript_87481/g.232259  ORF Transcript_87481/g.232259 Transcript_87481/m.232259 type:complete len:401 (+) Transcript_87481:90-1292(+)